MLQSLVVVTGRFLACGSSNKGGVHCGSPFWARLQRYLVSTWATYERTYVDCTRVLLEVPKWRDTFLGDVLKKPERQVAGKSGEPAF